MNNAQYGKALQIIRQAYGIANNEIEGLTPLQVDLVERGKPVMEHTWGYCLYCYARKLNVTNDVLLTKLAEIFPQTYD